jgi:hypothetical protein
MHNIVFFSLTNASVLYCCSVLAFHPCRYPLQLMLSNKNRLDKLRLIAAVGRMVPALHQEQAVYEVDCRAYLPRPLPYTEGMHTGCHPALFERVVQDPNFRDLLQEIRVHIEDDLEMKRTNVGLLLCDELGRHGSVAIGKALAECIVADPLCTLGTVHILADQHSDTYCGVCARCEFWTRRWTSRNMSVRAVWDMWFKPAE